MKRKLILIWLVIMMLALSACSGTDTKETGTTEPKTVETSKDTKPAENTAGTKEEDTAAADMKSEEDKTADETAKETEPSVETMGPEAFDKLLMELPVSIVKTKYTVQDEKYKSLYPDLLQAVLQNNTDEDIKSAVIAFVAWDKNGLPVKITGYLSFGGGSYVNEVQYGDINLAAGSTYGDESGLQLDDSTKDIDTFKAVVVSYETFEGSTWENPYYDAFCKLYGEKKLNPEATIEVKVEKTENNSSNNTAKSGDKKKEKQDDKNLPSEKELSGLLKAEPVFIKSTKYIVQDEKYKTLYPDMLQAVIQNNTKEDIKSAMVAFAAWDKNGLPVKIKGHLSFDDGVYIAEVDYSDINLAAGGTYGKDSGFQLDENLEIETFKAIVVSYETYDGTEWENPHYKNFCSLYEGKKQKK